MTEPVSIKQTDVGKAISTCPPHVPKMFVSGKNSMSIPANPAIIITRIPLTASNMRLVDGLFMFPLSNLSEMREDCVLRLNGRGSDDITHLNDYCRPSAADRTDIFIPASLKMSPNGNPCNQICNFLECGYEFLPARTGSVEFCHHLFHEIHSGI